MEHNNDLQEEYNKLDHEAAKYNRREFDLVYEIISELVKGRNDVGDNGNVAFPLVKGEVIDEAINRAGFSNDESFIADFKHYRDIEQKARNLQLHALEQTIKNMGNSSFDDTLQKYGFVKSIELQEIMDSVISKAKEENPYFPFPLPFDGVTKEDERLDQLFGSKGYNIINAWMKPYFDELKRCQVDNLLNEIGFPVIDLFILINKVGEDIKNNSDKPILLQNKIIDVLHEFNKYKGPGQVIQLLFLLGIIKWFEGCDINEGDDGYKEAQNLLDNIFTLFVESFFTYKMYVNKDEHTEPLDRFMDSEDIVKWLNKQSKDQIQSETKADKEVETIKGLSCCYEPDQLGEIFDKLNEKKQRIDPKQKADFISIFQNIELKNWKPVKWTGSNSELATLIFKLTSLNPVPSIVNKYFDPEHKYDSHSHGGGRNDNYPIKRIINRLP